MIAHQHTYQPHAVLSGSDMSTSPLSSDARMGTPRVTRDGQTPLDIHSSLEQHMPQQYAKSGHGSSPHLYINETRERTGREQTQATNMLRRKTPNGTLDAAYDGTIQEERQSKYIRMPARPDGRQVHEAPKHLPSSLHGAAQQMRDDTRRIASVSQQQSLRRQSWNGNQTQFAQRWNGNHAKLPQMDSVLHQVPRPYPQPQRTIYGQTMPNIPQPEFYYTLGPTASTEQGPYGPYWPDGGFIPYRPAALRDPRLYGHPLSAAHVGHAPYHVPPQWSMLGSNVRGYVPYGASANDYNHSAFTQHQPRASGISTPSYHLNSTTYQHQLQLPPTYEFASGVQNTNTEQSSDFRLASEDAEQRDKVFSWALQMYRDLLSYINHTRRQSQHGRASGAPVPQMRPSILPKPPRQLSGGLPLPQPSRGHNDAQFLQAAHSTSVQSSEGLGNVSDTTTSNTGSGRPNERVPFSCSPISMRSHDVGYSSRAARPPMPPGWPQPPVYPDDAYSILRRPSGVSIAPIFSPSPHDDLPPSKAIAALQLLTKLCQKSGWQWTDGMHLGGCLAYGLGNYNKALMWYLKVLDLDSKQVTTCSDLVHAYTDVLSRHLEAMSNLAATLFALGRRQEAEQHWMKVVKLAPNHFEAVEHLVGLLCGSKRGKDAIKVIEYVERSLRQSRVGEPHKNSDRQARECSSSTASKSPCFSENSDKICYDFDVEGDGPVKDFQDVPGSSEPGFGSSGYAISGSDNGRILALIHAKGNLLYQCGDNEGAASAFEDAMLIATGRHYSGIQGLVQHILSAIASHVPRSSLTQPGFPASMEPILLSPDKALETAKYCFPHNGELPGLNYVPGESSGMIKRAAISTTSNSLLSLAKIFQDGMGNTSCAVGAPGFSGGVRDILALYYLSLSLQPSPSTANNVGILLASIQHATVPRHVLSQGMHNSGLSGAAADGGISLALSYYNYGLLLDSRHAHLYTNLGSLLKDVGQLDAAIQVYERAVECDGKFDIALANLANAVKDKGRIGDAIGFYHRAVEVNPDFAEAVCGLANALNSVCSWQARGGIVSGAGVRDRWHVDANGVLLDATMPGASSSGWIQRVVEIVNKQLDEGELWGIGCLADGVLEDVVQQVTIIDGPLDDVKDRAEHLRQTLSGWAGQRGAGAKVIRLVERATRRIGWHWYQDKYVKKKQRTAASYDRPQLPAALTVPTAPTVLPFHTFTCPMSAKQIRLISQRNGLRISTSALRAPWLPTQVYSPPAPPSPHLKVGYVSSDFNNHPLAHLMQSVFGLHNTKRVEAYCYATTASDNSVHRRQIEAEAPFFHDASSWSPGRLIDQIIQDGIHILVNLNGYTRGARNEVFASRPAPIQMSFMGFAGTLGAEWCDYLLADETAIPPSTLRPWRRNVDLEDQMVDENDGGECDDWVYGENIIYCRDTFFCCDHKQSAPDSGEERTSWEEEQRRRWQMRKELFPNLPDDAVIFGNFNQLYKIEPTIFRTWLRILARVPNAILWLLRFPDLGESHLLSTARLWA
ncbi:hypothetical protein LTR66_006386, partial [Elasticomyces elasticus]